MSYLESSLKSSGTYNSNFTPRKQVTVVLEDDGINGILEMVPKMHSHSVNKVRIEHTHVLSKKSKQRLENGLEIVLNNLKFIDESIYRHFYLLKCRRGLPNIVLETDFGDIPEEAVIMLLLSVIESRKDISFQNFVKLLKENQTVNSEYSVKDIEPYSFGPLACETKARFGNLSEPYVLDLQKFLELIESSVSAEVFKLPALMKAGSVVQHMGTTVFLKDFRAAGGFELSDYDEIECLMDTFSQHDISEYGSLYRTRVGLSRTFKSNEVDLDSLQFYLFDYELAWIADMAESVSEVLSVRHSHMFSKVKFGSFLAYLVIVAGEDGLVPVYEFVSMCLDGTINSGWLVNNTSSASERQKISDFVIKCRDDKDFYSGVSLQMYLDIIG